MSAIALARKPTVVLADDHPAMLGTVQGLLAPHFEILAAVGDGRSALEAAAKTNPDLFVSDIMMPGLNGFETARALKQRGTPAAVAFLTGQEDDDFISEALTIGAHGFIVKRRMHSDLVPALNSVLTGQYFISPHAFGCTENYASSGHVLEFYLQEDCFFRRMSESILTALSNGDVVFVFLSRRGLRCVREYLSDAGVSLFEAIRMRKYVGRCVETVIPFLFRRGWPDRQGFETYFSHSLDCAAARAREVGAKVRVFSDVMATMLGQNHDQSLALEVEAIWNDLVSRHSCVVRCGCPAMHLSSGENRQTLARICGTKSSVIPIES